MRDDTQRLIFHCGWSANFCLKEPVGTKKIIGEKEITTNADAWRLTVIKSQNKPKVNKDMRDRYRNKITTQIIKILTNERINKVDDIIDDVLDGKADKVDDKVKPKVKAGNKARINNTRDTGVNVKPETNNKPKVNNKPVVNKKPVVNDTPKVNKKPKVDGKPTADNKVEADDDDFEFDMSNYAHIIEQYRGIDVKTINKDDIKEQIDVPKRFSDKWEQYNGKVYCCTVPTKLGVIYVRNKSCPVWSGNSRSKMTAPNR